MKKLLGILATLFFGFYSAAGYALGSSDFNKTIVRVGTQGNSAYIALSPALTIGPSGTCLYDILYIADLSSPAGKAYYATLLTAFSLGKPVSRVDYANNGAGTVCTVSLLEVQ